MRTYRQRGEETAGFERPMDMPPPLYRLLVRRGVRSAQEAERFLHPGVEDLNDPFLLSDMPAAVQTIRATIEAGRRIVVYGDYDVDGVCASAILSQYLRFAGADVEVYLPSRHSEGYGLNEAAVRTLAERCALMVTVDCGITCAAEVALAQSLGMEVVVTDHHRPGELLPDCAVVNPLLEGYPCPFLCGAGVAFQLVAALAGREEALRYVDLAALATVADIVPLTGENRAIVSLGLSAINREPRPGVQALIEAAGLEDRQITSGNIGFQLAPRLNAGGRLGSAHRPLELLVEREAARAQSLAMELDAENGERRGLEQQILTEALEMLREFDFPSHRAIVLKGKGWNPGVIGLAASRLVEQFHYPTILLASDGELCVGSCRSIEGVDIHAALTVVKQYFVRFGGHRQAAGLTIREENVDAFVEDLNRHLSETIPPEAYVPVDEYDLEVSFAEMGDVFVQALDDMQPTGMGNPAPVFRACAEVREARAVGRDGAHLKLRLMQEDRLLDAICFREGGQAAQISGEQDFLFTPKLNTYMGKTSVQLELKAISPRDNRTRLEAKVSVEDRLCRRFLTDILYNRTYPDNSSPAEPVEMDDLAALLRGTVQGTLIVADSLQTARELLRELDGAPLDLSIGAYPADPRAFNALAVYPTGALPRGYTRCVLADLPLDMGGMRTLRLARPACAWREELPDVDALREIYKALRRVLARPIYARTLEAICHALAEESGLGKTAALAGLLALADMNLASLRLDGERAELEILPMRKADPNESEVFRRICALKQKQV